MKLLDKISEYLESQPINQLNKANRIIDSAHHALKAKKSEDGSYTVRVPSESSNEVYDVDLDLDGEFGELSIICECPAFWDHDDCKHCVAAAITVRDSFVQTTGNIIPLFPPQNETKSVDEGGYFHFKMTNIDNYKLLKLAGNPGNTVVNKIANSIKPGPIGTAHQCFSYYEKSKKICDVDILYDEKSGFKTRCTCADKYFPLCKHVVGGFMYLEYHYSTYYFSKFKQHTDEKNKILAAYGLTVNDPEAKDFEWNVSTWGTLTLKNKPAYLIAAGSKDFLQGIKQSILGNAEAGFNMVRPRLPENVIVDYEVGFLFNFTSAKHIRFELETVFVRDKKGKTDVKKLALNNQSNLPYLQSLSDDIFHQLMEFTDGKLVDWMANNGSNYLKIYANPWQQISETDRQKLRKHYLELLKGLWPFLCKEPFVFQLSDGHFSNAAVKPVKLSETPFKLIFTATGDGRFITIEIGFKTDSANTDAGKITSLKSKFILEDSGMLFLPQNAEDILLMEKFEEGALKFPVADKLDVIRNVLLPLQSKYEVDAGASFNFDISSPEPVPHLLLSEFEDKFLMLKPRFQYDNTLIEYDDSLEYIEQSESGLKIIKRNKPEEKRLYEYLRTLHPKFASQRNNLYYFLPFGEVMLNGWFLNMIQQVQDAGYPVFGLQDLKTFRYNTNVPTFEIEAGSGIDWFDLKIEIRWGDQQVSLKEIRKALLNKQEAILLDDGTLGMIPAEWLEQYGMLLKIGAEKENSIQLSKMHYSLLDDLGGKLNNERVEQEIAEKKRKLQTFTGIQNHLPPSAAVTAQLRPYQLTGFQWLQALDELGWGGCLADDMGLGKTLQAITFLQFLKEKDNTGTQLIVCPTSLIFNWENELNKFCPTLKYHT